MNYKYNFTLYRFSILNLMGHMVADFFIQQMTLFVLNIKRLLIKKTRSKCTCRFVLYIVMYTVYITMYMKLCTVRSIVKIRSFTLWLFFRCHKCNGNVRKQNWCYSCYLHDAALFVCLVTTCLNYIQFYKEWPVM